MMIGEFLKSQCGSAGVWNCSTMPADWCVSLGHPDFAAAWRDIVEPEACEAVPADAGGLLVLWDRGIAGALPVVTEPEAGDIGVVTFAGVDRGAIFTGERWAIRGARALHSLSVDDVTLIKAWRP